MVCINFFSTKKLLLFATQGIIKWIFPSYSTLFKFNTSFAKCALMESHLLSVSHPLRLPPSPPRCALSTFLYIFYFFLRNDNCIRRLETEEVTGCQREGMEEADITVNNVNFCNLQYLFEEWQSRKMFLYGENEKYNVPAASGWKENIDKEKRRDSWGKKYSNSSGLHYHLHLVHLD